LPDVMKMLGFMIDNPGELKDMAETVSHYATVDFDEFASFTDQFRAMEKKKFKEVFDKFDEDGGGELSTDELNKLMSELGFTPLRSMIQEALAAVDGDGTGTVDFEEFLQLLTIYRYSEGFTRKEVRAFYRVFIEFAEAPEDNPNVKMVPITLVDDLLLKYFGPQSATQIFILAGEAKAGRPTKPGDEDKPKVPPPDLGFSECLILGRRLREFEFADWRNVFMKNDADGSGQLVMQEVQIVVKELGYTLTLADLKEVLAEVEEKADEDGEQDGELDFDEFVCLMMIFKMRDGFSKQELRELHATFKRFDHDGGGEIETIELGDMLRFLGHSMTLEEVQKLVGEVDFNESGSLDWREFLRFMRLQREGELTQWRAVFNRHLESPKALGLTRPQLVMALTQLGCEAPKEEPKQRGSVTDGRKENRMIDFDTFVIAINKGRVTRVAEQRRCAGFGVDEVKTYRGMFNTYDADRSGTIEPKEVGALLDSLGFSMKTPAERDAIQIMMETSRENAKFAGVADVGSGGSVTFEVLVQLLRLLFNKKDQARLDKEKLALEQTEFSMGESTEFRQIFVNWCEQEKQFNDEAAANQGKKVDPSQEIPKEVTKDGLRRLLTSLGLKVGPPQKITLEQQVDKITVQVGVVDFPDFLRFMKWTMDTNFCGIKG